MAVAPQSGELLRLSAEVNLLIKKICDRYVIEFDADSGYLLFYCNKLFDKQ